MSTSNSIKLSLTSTLLKLLLLLMLPSYMKVTFTCKLFITVNETALLFSKSFKAISNFALLPLMKFSIELITKALSLYFSR